MANTYEAFALKDYFSIENKSHILDIQGQAGMDSLMDANNREEAHLCKETMATRAWKKDTGFLREG